MVFIGLSSLHEICETADGLHVYFSAVQVDDAASYTGIEQDSFGIMPGDVCITEVIQSVKVLDKVFEATVQEVPGHQIFECHAIELIFLEED